MIQIHTAARAGALLALLALGCTSGNPQREESRWKPQEPTAKESKPAAASDEPTPRAETVAAPEDEPASSTSFGMQQAGANPIIARVSSDTIQVGELLEAWMQVNAREVSDIIERLVSAKLVEIEARRIGMKIDPKRLEAGYELTVQELEEELSRTHPGVSVDAWIIGFHGMEPEHYRRGLRDDVMRRLLAERVVRTFILGNERRNVRVIVTETREEIEDVLAELRAGGDFGEFVVERSIDPSKEFGGRIPAILRSPAPVSRLGFLTDIGKVGGPIQEGEAGRWMILIVDSEEPALEGPWSEIGKTIEDSLVTQPIADPEYWQWKVEMNRRHEVDLEPLFDLMGAAMPVGQPIETGP